MTCLMSPRSLGLRALDRGGKICCFWGTWSDLMAVLKKNIKNQNLLWNIEPYIRARRNARNWIICFHLVDLVMNPIKRKQNDAPITSKCRLCVNIIQIIINPLPPVCSAALI